MNSVVKDDECFCFSACFGLFLVVSQLFFLSLRMPLQNIFLPVVSCEPRPSCMLQLHDVHLNSHAHAPTIHYYTTRRLDGDLDRSDRLLSSLRRLSANPNILEPPSTHSCLSRSLLSRSRSRLSRSSYRLLSRSRSPYLSSRWRSPYLSSSRRLSSRSPYLSRSR